jgi:ABC-type dipeptide/oligopeptide/nickel transport system ATPase component
VQAQILRLLRTLMAEHAGAVILISHDLGVVAQLAGRVAVMQGGEIVEQAPVRELFAQPRHPYTRQLLSALPGAAKAAAA